MSSVLVVDDQTDVRRAIVDILRPEGFTVRSATSGADAIRKQRKNPANVILMDMKMPGLDGVATASRIKTFDKRAALIGVTAYRGDHEAAGRRVGIHRWIPKPVVGRAARRKLIDAVRAGVGDANERSLPGVSLSHVNNDGRKKIQKALRLIRDAVQGGVTRWPKTGTSADADAALHLFATACLIEGSEIARGLFSRSMFAEAKMGPSLQKELAKIEITSLAEAYDRDFKVLARLAAKK